MIKCIKTNFRTNKTYLQQLFECNRKSAQVWNDCLSFAKDYALSHGKWINQTKLQKSTKGKYNIHSQSIQAVVHKYLWARDAAKKARDKGYAKNKYPYKKKNNFNTKWAKDGFVIHESGKIELKMGNWGGKRQNPIVVWVEKDLLVGKEVKEIELMYDRKLMLSMSFEDGFSSTESPSSNIASIDEGEIHAIAAVSDNNNAIIITGRKLRSIKRLRNKKVAELQHKMSKCKKGSRQWKRYNRAKVYILSKSDKQLKDALHKISHNFVEWAVQNSIKEVVAGDVEGVQRGTSRRNKNKTKRRSRKTNQKISQWQFGKLNKYLEYKLLAKNITFSKINESYTSQTCPVCAARKKVKTRNYKCRCGYTMHRDIHGAINIMSKYLYDDIHHLGLNPVIKYRQIA